MEIAGPIGWSLLWIPMVFLLLIFDDVVCNGYYSVFEVEMKTLFIFA